MGKIQKRLRRKNKKNKNFDNKYKNIKNMKKIGIVGHFTGANSFGITKAYMQFFSFFGQVTVISPWEKEVRELDLLVLPGGPDVDPYRYLSPEEDIHIYTQQPCMQRERFDRMLLPKYVAQNTPIFGICRGHQSLAVFFGGKLIQHMFHETNKENESRSKPVHEVRLSNLDIVPGLEESLTEQRLGKKGKGTFSIVPTITKVNSLHHQTVAEDALPTTALIMARHIEDEEVEALTYWPHYPAHSVQWHPEELYDNFSVGLIKHLLNLE